MSSWKVGAVMRAGCQAAGRYYRALDSSIRPGKPMTRLFLLASLCLVAAPAFACGDKKDHKFGPYDGGPGPAAQVQGKKVTIDTSFLARLEAKPDGATYALHRNELLYLLSIDDAAAVRAGVRVLAHLIAHPKFVGDCGGPRELYGKDELAFALSRAGATNRVICELPAGDREAIVALYTAHPKLWHYVDPPGKGYSCAPIEVTP